MGEADTENDVICRIINCVKNKSVVVAKSVYISYEESVYLIYSI